MTLNGSIHNFGHYNDAQLEQMKTDLGIGMPIPKLKLCAAYYREKALRDPYIEELRFLDAFLQKASNSSVAVAPKELLTNDAFVAKTYADLIEKRRKTHPDAQKPCSLDEAFTIMGHYLERVGKTVRLPHEAYALENLHQHPTFAESEEVLCVKDAPCGLRRSFRRAMPLDRTDILVVLTSNSAASSVAAISAYNTFLSDSSVMSAIKDIRPVGECGILYETLRMSQGVRFNLDSLSLAESTSQLSALTDAYIGCYLLRIANSSYSSLATSAKALGLCALPAATLADPTAVAIMQNGQTVLAWRTEFIRSLFEFSPVSMCLDDEADGACAPIQTRQHSKGDCVYLSSNQTDAAKTLLQCGNSVYTAAFCAPQSAFFRNAIDTVLSTVIETCACGIPFTQQRLAIDLALPSHLSESETSAAAMSTILGLYRIESELAIPMAFGKISHTDCVNSPEIGVFGLATGTAISDSFCREGHRLYCVMPEYEDTGIPDFDKLRVFLDWLTTLSQSGVLKSARVVCRQKLCDALKEMETDQLSVCFASGVEHDDRTLPLAVILETEAELSVSFVGSTQLRTKNEQGKEQDETTALPAKCCLIPSKKPLIVITALSEDRDAHILAAYLNRSGADSFVHFPSDDPLELASHLLQARCLILCGEARLPSTPEVAFAAETLARANGYLLQLGDTKMKDSTLPFVHLDALSKQNAEQICKITNN